MSANQGLPEARAAEALREEIIMMTAVPVQYHLFQAPCFHLYPIIYSLTHEIVAEQFLCSSSEYNLQHLHSSREDRQ